MRTLPNKKQLEELQMIKFSLLQNETLVFLDESEAWARWLADFEADSLPAVQQGPISPARVEIKVYDSPMFFVVEIPLGYSGNLGGAQPIFAVKGDQINRIEQDRWQRLIKDKLEEIADSEYPIYQLISLHLLPLIQEQRFAKVGYPGVIYAEGMKEDIEEFVANIKAMQWLALRVRFIEEVLIGNRTPDKGERRWIEFSKVGEVVEEMRKLGREQLVVEMGIGSAGPK
ncbi:hypothetical protein H0H81_008701 [Sphagnurus paluster]|uniref:Uncharacterized protein n=1 Tax=Sphagnurus paluster TaxID=117069 RepID=A0A9P7G1A4_9AGAR|nr:hypothetical protein H0H81_008701 [Sphagnurus paluster]